MFYSQFILAKKGPLGTIWIAAHLERKLRKNQVAETDIGVTVDNILFPEVPIALRLSGHLLLGVVRIYSRQVNYLFNDCSETLGKIKQAFHAAAVDLPPEATTAPFHSITLPETFDFDELELAPDSEAAFLYSKGKYVDHHVTTREQITLQDCIENNPYLGSSQFGLDERFGDGSYPSLGLDFDEEFWASKAGSSSFASTSTPLLKEDAVLPAGGENEVIYMDVEDPYQQPLESELQKDTPMTEAVDTEAGQIERDEQLNMSIPAISAAPFNEPGGLETASRKQSDFAALKNDAPTFHVYTPRVLEACTPDLNQEYCPPDEPSTPALADETSLAVYKECNAESARRLSPVTLGNTEKSSSGLLPVSSSPQQVSCVNTLASSVQAARSSSPASFQGFPLQQAALPGTNRDAFLSEKEKGQLFASKENAASASMTFQSFPQLTTTQQTSTPVFREGAVFQTGASSSSSTTCESSVFPLGQRDGNPLMTANQQLAGVVNEEPYPRFQHQGLAAGSQTPVSSSAAMVEPTATVNREVHERVQEQGLAVGSQNSGSSFGAVNREVYERVQQQGPAVGSQNLGSSFGAVVGSAGTINHGVHASSQQQGLAVGPPNPVSAFGAITGLAGTVNQGTYPSFQQQGLAVDSQNPGSSLSSSRAMVGSPGTVLHGVRASSQQKGLAEGSPNPVSSFGALAGSSGTGIQETYPSFQQQGLALGSQSSLPASGALGETVENVKHGVRLSPQQQELAVGSSNPVSSFGAMAGSAGTGNQGTYPSIQQQGLELASPNPVSLLSASGAVVGSTEIANHGVHANSQQQGLAVGSLNQVPSFGATAGSAGAGNQVTFPSSQHQGVAAASLNPASSLSTSGAMVGSTEIENHGVHAISRQQGLAIGSSNPVSSFGAVAGSVGTKNQGTYPSFQQPGLAVAPLNPLSSLSASGAMVGSAETVNYGVHASSRLQGLAVGSPNPVSSFGAIAGSAGTGNQGTYTSFQQQGLAAASPNPESSLSASGAMVGSAEIVNHGVHASSQQQGPAFGSPNSVSSFGAMAGSAGTGNQGTYASFQQQGRAVTSPNPVPSSSSFGAIAGSVGAVNHGIHASSQQQGLAGGLLDPVSSFGAMAGLAGTSNKGTYPSFQQQGLASTSPNPVSPLSSFGANVGSPATVNHGAHASSVQQGLAVGAPNPVSSFGAMAGSTGTGNQGTHPSFQQQGLAAASPNPVASLSSFGAMAGSAGTVNHGFHISSQQQGFAVGSQNPVSSFGAMVKSSETVNQGTYPIFQQQGLAVGSQNLVSSSGAAVESTFSHPSTTMRNIGASQVLASPIVSQASITPLFSPSSGSPLPVTNILPSGHLESMNSRKERAHETLDSAALKSPFRPSVPQQLSISSPTAMPGILPSMRLGERETLRAAYDSHSGSPGFLMLQKDMTVERIPGLELERNKSFSVSTDGFSKEATRPAMDRTPMWREETPYSYTRAPFMSAHSIDSIPADDDVLASILGRRNKDFKVVPTPKAPKEPKVNAAKRPKRAPRVTPKKRKIDIDAVAVLHGDVIRQQLANAEDIRRDRRKAPCTRREVWAFIRESEGQENFDEPTLPELSHDLHDLYHDVLHGPESRASASALNGALKANQLPESQLIRSGETDSLLVNGLNNGANKLGPRGDSDHLVVGTNKDRSRDAFMNEFPRIGENNSAEGYAEQLNGDAKLAVAETHAGGSLIQIEDAEKLTAKDLFKADVNSEGMARKESDGIALPESQAPEDYNSSSLISRETEANQQAKQTDSLDREVEAPGPTQNDIVASSLSQNVMGVVGADEGIAMTVQKDVLGAVGGDEGIAMTAPQDALGAVGGDEVIATTAPQDALGAVGGDEVIAMTAPQDALGAVGGDGGITMTSPQDVLGAVGGDGGIAVTPPQEVLGVVGGDGGITMTAPQDVFGGVGGDGGIAMRVQQDVFGVVGGEGGIGMGVLQDVLGVVGGDEGIGLTAQKDVLGVVGGDEGIGLTVQKDVLGVVGGDVGNQERAMAMQQDTDRVDDKQQLSFGVHEHELTLLGKEADFKPLDIPSDGKHLTEVPMLDGKDVLEAPLLNVVHIDHGNAEGSDKTLDVDRANLEGTDKLPTSTVTEEGTNLSRDDEDMVAMDCERDTDFLDDDNDGGFAEIDYSSDDEQDASIQDSNGWSARSRNVGRYLKTTFEEMEGNSKRLEQPTLALERLLARKTRREAARMFFETLVLKTKDYIHVEQNVAYQDIHLYPKSKLMKTEF